MPEVVNKFVSAVKFKEATEQGVQISTARRLDKEVFGLTMLQLIRDLLTNFKRIRRIETDEEIYHVINQISAQYWFMKVEEIAYCFQGIKIGKYVKILDCIDGGIIMLALAEYDKERLDTFFAEHETNKKSNSPVVELAKKLGEETAEKMKDDIKEREIKKDKIYEQVTERLIREKMQKQEERLKYIEQQKIRAQQILKNKKHVD